jgi:hypothetical protein
MSVVRYPHAWGVPGPEPPAFPGKQGLGRSPEGYSEWPVERRSSGQEHPFKRPPSGGTGSSTLTAAQAWKQHPLQIDDSQSVPSTVVSAFVKGRAPLRISPALGPPPLWFPEPTIPLPSRRNKKPPSRVYLRQDSVLGALLNTGNPVSSFNIQTQCLRTKAY